MAKKMGAPVFLLLTLALVGGIAADLPSLPTENTNSDNDGWSDFQEDVFGSDKSKTDTDGDGVIDDLDRNPTESMELELYQSAPPELDNPEIPNSADLWPEIFDNAQHSIYLETYYISNSIPDEIIDSLKSAAARGVDIKIILDNGMYWSGYSSMPDELDSYSNVEVRLLPLNNLSGGWLHAKYFVVDNEVAYIGGQNWSWTGLNESLDVGLFVRNRSISTALLSVFERDWIAAGGEPLRPTLENDTDNDGLPDEYESWLGTDPTKNDTDEDGSEDGWDPNPFVATHTPNSAFNVSWMRVVETPPTPQLDNPNLMNTEEALVQLIDSASTRVRAMLYKYTTGGGFTALDDALRETAARGVQVQLMVDKKYFKEWDHSEEALLDLVGVPNVEVKLVDIRAIGSSGTSGWLHAKTLFVDGEKAYVGSANWFGPHIGFPVSIGDEIFGSTRDLGVVFESPEIVGELESIFTTAWDSPYVQKLVAPSFDFGVVGVILGVLVIFGVLFILLTKRRPRLTTRTAEFWYLYQDGKRYGPAHRAILKRWIAEGRVRSDAMVWKKGLERWYKIDELRDEISA